jgi:hypothetical protein
MTPIKMQQAMLNLKFNRLARICHGFRADTPRDITKRKKHPEWQPTNSVL